MTEGSRHLARKTAVQALYQWGLTEQSADDIENHFINDHDFAGVDMAYFHHLVRNVPLYHQEIDSRLAPYIDRSMNLVDPVELAILRIGAYELEFESTIPVRVIIDEAVELSKMFGAEHGFRFVNGVLDKVAAELRSE
ncbi:MAG: transcription antitermination factor NusB [Proteobacteria bacterium]|nr:MAG: transcription antitermination factor NusB [Pseudomonadota bacterium]